MGLADAGDAKPDEVAVAAAAVVVVAAPVDDERVDPRTPSFLKRCGASNLSRKRHTFDKEVEWRGCSTCSRAVQATTALPSHENITDLYTMRSNTDLKPWSRGQPTTAVSRTSS